MENESILFQPISGENEALPAVRKTFRVPVAENDDVQVVLEGKIYSVLNISLGGISIVCDDIPDVECGHVRGGWELRLGQIRLQDLSARVIHCGSMASGQLLCGLQWVDLGEKEMNIINDAVARLKVSALGNNDLNTPPTQDIEK